ncbi:MAG: F0F1 ATP synthase subunit alpha [Candidatus Omnitrophica bacterium]|nr:F0F1 ATP synthase subunit alpha [Candidatus Omnitrophota bacterium]MCK5259601.1 F0F1 ATP synthase subunit alpha [Candidatus Omnitrophota bacterium]
METLQIREVGKIKEVKKSIAKIVGLTQCMIGQLLDITPNTKGIIMGFVEGEIIVFLLGKVEEARVGLSVSSDMKPFTIPVGEGFIGRVVNALAEPLDGKKEDVASSVRVAEYIDKKSTAAKRPQASRTRYPVFRPAPGVLQRVPIEDSLETGNLLIDAMIPIGKGQRELIIGDRMTGKTTIGVDTILNQKGKNIICIYCCIGRSYTSIRKVVETLKVNGALEYTIVIVAHAASSSGEQYLCPYTAATLGEYFMDRGKDVFIVFDDMTKHAWAYRQLSLLLERPPGRNAYPGDIFYIHSQLMERAGKYSPEFQGGTMTFFPIVDTIQGDVTGYIPSNLVSMTDGQIYLNTSLFNSGIRPAVDIGLSVSRIGNKVQCPAIKELSSTLRLEYLRYNELVKITRFKTNVSAEVNQRLRRGEVLTQLFSQENNHPYSLARQVVLLYALQRKVLSALISEEVENFKETIFEFIENTSPELIEDITKEKELTISIKKRLDDSFVTFFRNRDKNI